MMKTNMLGFSCLVALCLSSAVAMPAEDQRAEKLFPVFNLVQFPNDVCVANSRNGTCYTAEECASKGGTSGTACASGFGVCCTFVLSCGNSTSENNTYLVQASTTTAQTCSYTICKSDPRICRIKFDFNSFTLANPFQGTTDGTGGTTQGSAIGDCTVDTFQITNNGKPSPPQICGPNSGQHMIVDASDNCHTVNFRLGAADTTTQRSWTIAVSQYDCGQEDIAGPSGCLQFHTGTSGKILDYGKATNAASAAFAATTSHLSNQEYDICIRRADTYCAICYIPSIPTGAAITSATFGLSLSINTIAKSDEGSSCSQDYITIPGGQSQTISQIAGVANTDNTASRFCGRFFDTTAAGIIASASVCTRSVPFVVGVKFDADEVTGAADAETNEQDDFPGGIVGFDLAWAQQMMNC